MDHGGQSPIINPVLMGRVMIDGSGSHDYCWIVLIQDSYMRSMSIAPVSTDGIRTKTRWVVSNLFIFPPLSG